MPADWFDTLDPYLRVTAFVFAFVALNVVFILGFGYRSKRHEVYALHQVVNDDGIRSSIRGFHCEFEWATTTKIVENGAYILLFHEGGRYYIAVPSRGFNNQDRREFLTYCRDHISSTRSSS
nr:YcxB family protein [Ciceribacter sp. L1K23]